VGTALLCYITEDVGASRGLLGTRSGCMITLEACKLRRSTYCLGQCEALESFASRASTPGHSLTVAEPRISCIGDELLRSRHSTYHREGVQSNSLADTSRSCELPP
jgi:hypothetical protein